MKCSTVCFGRKLQGSVLIYVLDGSWSEVFYCMCLTEAGVKCFIVCADQGVKCDTSMLYLPAYINSAPSRHDLRPQRM